MLANISLFVQSEHDILAASFGHDGKHGLSEQYYIGAGPAKCSASLRLTLLQLATVLNLQLLLLSLASLLRILSRLLLLARVERLLDARTKECYANEKGHGKPCSLMRSRSITSADGHSLVS